MYQRTRLSSIIRKVQRMRRIPMNIRTFPPLFSRALHVLLYELTSANYVVQKPFYTLHRFCTHSAVVRSQSCIWYHASDRIILQCNVRIRLNREKNDGSFDFSAFTVANSNGFTSFVCIFHKVVSKPFYNAYARARGVVCAAECLPFTLLTCIPFSFDRFVGKN